MCIKPGGATGAGGVEAVVGDALSLRRKDSVHGGEMKKEKAGPSVAFSELFRYADGFDKFLIVAGTVGAIASGLSLPVLLFIQAKLLNSFGTLRGDELYREACKVCALIFKFENAGCMILLPCMSTARCRDWGTAEDAMV